MSTRAQRAVVQGGAGAKVTVQVDAPAPVIAVLRKGFFAGASCAGDIAR